MIHRADYLKILVKEAIRLGTTVIWNAEVSSVEESDSGAAVVILTDGKQLDADVVVGADGTVVLPNHHTTVSAHHIKQGSGRPCGSTLLASHHLHLKLAILHIEGHSSWIS